MGTGALGVLAALAALSAAHADVSVSTGELPTIVVQSTAIAGNAIDIDKIPGNVNP